MRTLMEELSCFVYDLEEEISYARVELYEEGKDYRLTSDHSGEELKFFMQTLEGIPFDRDVIYDMTVVLRNGIWMTLDVDEYGEISIECHSIPSEDYLMNY